MRQVGWNGGCVPCKSRCCCLSPLFGEEMRVWVQRGKNHSSLSPVRQWAWKDGFQHHPNLNDTSVCFGGYLVRLPGDGEVLLGGVMRRLQTLPMACAHTDRIYPRWWARAWCPCQDQSQLVSFAALGRAASSAATYRSNPSQGKQFEIRQTGEQLPKGMKISLFHA